MRARNIKPSFFANEQLAELHPLTRILFEALWCIADREGRMDDKPKRIKVLALPYDEHDVDAALWKLHASGFINRYENANGWFIQVVQFRRHQHPHINETGSTILAPESHQSRTVQAPESTIHERNGSVLNGHFEPGERSTRVAPESHQSTPSDSGFRIPDSGYLIARDYSQDLLSGSPGRSDSELLALTERLRMEKSGEKDSLKTLSEIKQESEEDEPEA